VIGPRNLGLILTYATLVLLLVVALFPIALLMLNALKPTTDIVQSPLSFPAAPHWANFANAWRDANFGTTIRNSMIVAGSTIVLVCTTASLTAFVLARRKIRSWKLVTFYILGTSTVPIQLFIFPLYFGFAKLGLINNPLAVAFVYTAMFSPFAIMLLRTYFLAVPRELEEAAIIDGASPWQVFTMIFLPIVSPGVITVALIIGLYSWNEFLIALTFLQNREHLTAVVSFFLLSGQYTSDWGEIMAAALIIVLPIVILFVALQRRFIEGMAGGSVKG
jgi:raffinose/stachyose/melibiose transport system permease protein